MKKRVFSIFLVLALLLAALAGCGPNNADSSKSDDGEEAEQLLARGWYIVYDEDDELAGYLEVKSSKIIVYDDTANEGDTLRYDFDAKKDVYTIDDGELFGSEEFTVEKSRKKLILITEDDDEYTLEEIDKEDMPGPGSAKTPGFDEPAEDYIELPIGCYAVYDGLSLVGYLAISDHAMVEFDTDGSYGEEIRYSYDQDGNCLAEDSNNALTVRFTYEQGGYYMYYVDYDVILRLEPISETEIPVYDPAPTGDEYYIGDNGYIGLYAWLPDGLYANLDTDDMDNTFIAMAEQDNDPKLIFYAVLASGDGLQSAVDTARLGYGGDYSSDDELLYRFFMDNFFVSSLEEYLGDSDHSIEEDYFEINGREWRQCYVNAYENGGEAWLSLLFWMEGDSLAIVLVGGIAEESYYVSDMYDCLYDMIYSLRLDT